MTEHDVYLWGEAKRNALSTPCQHKGAIPCS